MNYGPPLDIFSFALFIATQVFPGDLLPHNYYTDPRKKLRKVQARTEIERRETYITALNNKLGKKHGLVVLIKECVEFEPGKCPTAKQERLGGM